MAQVTTLLTLTTLSILPTAHAAQWMDVATISSTLGNNSGYVCTGGGGTDLGCPVTAPYITSTGRVGIGTTNPSGSLHVMASSTERATIGGTGTNTATLSMYPAGSTFSMVTSNVLLLQHGNSSNFVISNGSTYARFGGSGANASLILGQGIGTTNPASTTLHVSGTLRIANGGETCDINRLGAIRYQSGAFDVCQNTTNGWEPLATAGANSNNDRIISGTTQAIAYQNTSLSLVTAGTERMVIGTTGEVGIGQQPNPSYTLAVSGTGFFRNDLSLARGSYIRMTNSNQGIPVPVMFIPSGYNNLILRSGTASPNTGAFAFNDYNGTPLSVIDTNGNLGLGKGFDPTVPGLSARLTVSGTSILKGNVAVGAGIVTASTTLHVSGTLRIASGGEACDTDRTGAIKYESGQFQVCRNGTSWETMVAGTSGTAEADRITSNSQAGITANSTGYISLTTGGVTDTAYFAPNGRLVISEISTTATVSTTNLYANTFQFGQTGSFTNSITPFQAYGIVKGDYAGIGGLEMRNTNGGTNADFRFLVSDERGAGGTHIAFGMPSSNNTTNLFGMPRNQMATIFVNATNDATARALALGTLKAHPIVFGTNNAEAMRITSTGLVGIGTTTPSATLHVAGAIVANGFVRSGGNGSTGNLQLYTSSGALLTNLTTSGGYIGSSSGATLGVGTSTPSTTLHVSGTLRIASGSESCDTDRLGALRYTSGAFQVCQNTTNGWEPLATSGASSNNDRIISGTTSIIANNNASATITINGVERMVIGTSGLVTVGSSPSPPSWMTSQGIYSPGSFVTRGKVQVVDGPVLEVSSGVAIIRNYNTSGSGLAIYSSLDSPEAIRIVSSGYVGIGTSTPSTTLHVKQTSTSSGLRIEEAGSNLISANMYINNAGDLAIERANTGISLRSGSSSRFAVTVNNLLSMNINPSASTWVRSMIVANTSNASTTTPATTLEVSGTLKIADSGESCDTSRLGALRYTSGAFQVCQNTTNGWEPLSTTSSATTVAINTGLSGSIVFRDELGVLKANNTFSISSTTGSVGIGAGAPAFLSNNSLNAEGDIRANNSLYTNRGVYVSQTAGFIAWGNSNNSMSGDGSPLQQYLRIITSGTEAMRIVSTGLVGIGTNAPQGKLHVILPDNQVGFIVDRTSVGKAGISIGGSPTAIGFGWTDNTLGYPAVTSGLHIVSQTQRMGIFTSAPSTTLEVQGTLRIANGGEACDTNRLGAIRYTSGAFQVCQNTTNGWEPLATTGASGNADRIISGTTQAIAYNGTSLSLVTAGTERVVIGTTGEVGIGQQPQSGYGLGVTGNMALNSGQLLFSNGKGISFGNNNTNIVGSSNAGASLIFTTSNTEAMRIGSTGLVGIGTTDPSSTLHVIGSIRASTFIRGTNIIMQNTDIFETQTNNGTGRSLSAGISINRVGTSGGTTRFRNTGIGNGQGQIVFYVDGPTSRIGMGTSTEEPSTTLHVSGTLKIANGGESCDTDRLGALRYTSGAFQVCQNTTNGWEALSTNGASSNADRITSNSQAGIIANSTGYISLTTGGVTGSAYFTPASVLVNAGVSTTGPISTTAIYVSDTIGIGTTTPSTPLEISVSNVSGVGTQITVRNGRSQGFAGLSAINNSGLSMSVGIGGQFNGSGAINRGLIGFSSNATPLLINAQTMVSNQSRATVANPSTTLQIEGTLRLSAETNAALQTCDANRTGAIKYESGQFQVCRNGTSWETLVAGASGTADTDRITSGTTNVTAYNNTGISFTTGGTERMAINSNGVGIGQSPAVGVALVVSGNVSVVGRIGVVTSGSNVFVGSSAGSANTGTNNTGFGHTTLGSNSGNYNVGMGMYALQNNTGNNSVAIGYVAGQANSGANLAALGYVAGQNNTANNVTVIGNASGQNNTGLALTAVGSSAGLSNNAINATLIGISAGQNNTGANTTAIGSTAGQTNSGAGLTAVGYGAGYGNSGLYTTTVGGLSGQSSSGDYLTAVGFQAAQFNTSGANNTALGTYAMNYSTTGSNNAIVGFQAGFGVSNSTVFSRNSLLGSFAGTALTTGSSNTLIGYLSGGGITTGSDNVVIGAYTSPFSQTGSYQLNIANAIWGNIGSGTGNANRIGINVPSPTTALEVSGTIKTTAAVQPGNADTTCAGSADYGKIRFDQATRRAYLCRP